MNPDRFQPNELAHTIEKQYISSYFTNAGIREIDLKNKKVVDIGAGARLLAGFATRKKITNDIYSVEPYLTNISPEEREVTEVLWDKTTKKIVDSHTIRAFGEQLPFADKSIDLVIVNASLPGTDAFGEGKLDEMVCIINKTFDEYIRILKANGEARIAPFFGHEYMEWRKPWKVAIDKKLSELQADKTISLSIQNIEQASITPEDPLETYTRIVIKKI